MSNLQIYDRRERRLVAAGDGLLAVGAAIARPFRRRRKPDAPRRILLFRLERIGDLLMALDAIADVRRLARDAAIDLVVGSWNEELAKAIPSVNRVEVLDARWLARDRTGLPLKGLLVRAAGWRKRRYDLGINFEPDIRSNLLLAAAGAAWTAGYRSAGGGALLDQALEYDLASHTSDNARRLVSQVFDAAPDGAGAALEIPDEHRRRARTLLGAASSPVVVMHIGGGRPVKQWEPDRFAAVASRLVTTRDATIVLTGSTADRVLIEQARRFLPDRGVIDASGDGSLLALAAILAEADLVVTGDTGPMHLAASVGTPIVAVFGPSDPRRYAPRGPYDCVVRVDLPCAPCNRIRLPPARCTGRTPDCLALLPADQVFDAATSVLDRCLPDRRARNASA